MQSLAILISILLIQTVRAKDCLFPIEIPSIQNVIVDKTATGIHPVATVVIRSNYPIVSLLWYTMKPGDVNSFGARDVEDGIRIKRIQLNHVDVQISFHTEAQTDVLVGFSVFYDVGCTVLSEDLYFNYDTTHSSFTAVNFGKILVAPQPETIYEPEKWFDIRYLIEADAMDVQFSFPVHRNRSEIVLNILLRNQPPFTTNDSFHTTATSANPNRHEINPRIKVSADILDFVIETTISTNVMTLNDKHPLQYAYARYVSNFHVQETTEPIFLVDQCQFNSVKPYLVDDVVVLAQEEGSMGCFYVTADGNPLPQMAVAEMRGNYVTRELEPMKYRAKLATMLGAHYQIGVLKGKTSEYKLFVLSTQGFRHQKIRIETYVPVSVSVPDRWFALSPGRLDLTCDVDGDFVSVGLYISPPVWTITNDLSTWKPFTIIQTSLPGTYVFTLDLNEDLVEQLMQGYSIFCGVIPAHTKRHMTTFGLSEYKFDFPPTLTNNVNIT